MPAKIISKYTFKCPVCENEKQYMDTVNNRKRKFCSTSCYYKSTAGSGNPNYKAKQIKFNCKTCGDEFESYGVTPTYCSLSCKGKDPVQLKRLAEQSLYAARQPKPHKIKLGNKCKCKACGIEFRSEYKGRRYCPKHKGKYMGGKLQKSNITTCVNCGESFKAKVASLPRKTCSKECHSDWQTKRQIGELSHFWQGGKTSEAMKIRNSKEYTRWRKAVFIRDDYTCQICGQRGGKLNADHIKAFSTHPDLRLDVDNGRTLCYECHLSTPNFGNRTPK